MFLERTWEKIRYSQGFHIAYFTLMLSIEKWKHVKRHNNRHKVEAYCKMAITLGTTGYALWMLFKRGNTKQKEEIKKHIEETIKETLKNE